MMKGEKSLAAAITELVAGWQTKDVGMKPFSSGHSDSSTEQGEDA